MSIFDDVKTYIDKWYNLKNNFDKEIKMSKQNGQDKCICCQGPVGPQGIPGVQGPQGNQGPRGEQGLPGPRGLQGAQGPQGDKGDKGDKGDVGPQGVQGISGQNGQDGVDGKDGPMGPMGPQGLQGQQGPKGDCVACPCECDHEFCQVYSQKQQMLSASPGLNMEGGQIIFEKLVVSTSNIDVSQASISGDIIVNKAGWYKVSKSVNGTLNPLSQPLIAWAIALFKNDVLVDGSPEVNMTLSPDQQDNQVSFSFLVHCNVGDKLGLYNMTNVPLILNNVHPGVNCAVNSAAFQILLLKAD